MLDKHCVPAEYIQAHDWEVEYNTERNKADSSRFMDLDTAIKTTEEYVSTISRNKTIYIYQLKAIISSEDREPKPTTVEVFE